MNSCDLTKWSIFSLLEPKFISNIHMAVVYGNNYFLIVIFIYLFILIPFFLHNIIHMTIMLFIFYF